MVYPPPPAYPGVPSQEPVRQHLQAGGTAWGAQGGKGEEHRRAWERIGEEGRRLREREARVMGGAARVAEGWTEGHDMPRGGEAQSVEELQRAWVNLRRRLGRSERAEREGGRHRESRGSEGHPPLHRFRQPAIPPEQEREMQERAWRQIKREATKLAERDRAVTAWERRVREEEEAVVRGVHRVLPDPEGDTPSTEVEGWSPSGMRARGEEGGAGQAGESSAGWRSGEQGKRRGCRGQPAPARSRHRQTGARSCHRRGNMRLSRCGESRDGQGVVGGGCGRAGPLREVGGEDEGGAGEASNPPFSDLVRGAGTPREREFDPSIGFFDVARSQQKKKKTKKKPHSQRK